MDEDQQMVKQLMSMLSGKRQLTYSSADGQIIKISLGSGHSISSSNTTEAEVDTNKSQNSNIQKLDAENFSLENTQCETQPAKNKKVTLRSSKYKKTEANEAVLNFMNESQKNIKQQQAKNTKIQSAKLVEQRLEFLIESHPQDKDHLQIIRQRMLHLQKIEEQKMKIEQQISSILSSSFSRSFDPSADVSVISMLGNAGTDPLCQLFNNYIKKSTNHNKSNNQIAPSFLYLYSQPMIDETGHEINDQINYFQQQAIIQKVLKTCHINYIRERATTNKFHYWLKQSVSIIHFCGHGVESQKNYLLFQSINGQSVKMDSDFLHKILAQMKNPLKLVFVASCHSETTGRIFAEAGACHVICVRDDYTIMDEACHEFVRHFYVSCINDKMKICEAFAFAKKQLILSGKFTSHECQKFILLKSHSEKDCQSLDIQSGTTFNDLTPKAEYSRNLPSRVQNFIPRPKDLHEILKLLESKRRFITITGYAGIGKSTLVRQLVRYIQFRDFFRDGVIYIDIRNCENIQKLFQTLNLQLFDNIQIKLNKKFQQNAQKICKQLSNKHVLIVLDNCQSIMSSNDRQDFKLLIETIMKNCVEIYFVFTHRLSIQRQIDYCSQKQYQLGRLNQTQSQRLFFQRVPRKIDAKQRAEFFSVQDAHLGKHPFFQFLNGHPQAICMTASLLSDRKLNDIYELLMKPCINISDQFGKLEEGDKLNKVVETAMKISLNVLKNKHRQASQMIKMLSLLPRGLDPQMMSKLFGTNWKENAKKLMMHSLVQYIDNGGPAKYYTVHPHIITYVENQLSSEQKSKYHDKICEQFQKRIQKIYKFVGTTSPNSQKAHEQFLNQEINYQAIIYRQLGICGDFGKLRRLYGNLFQKDFNQQQQAKQIQVDIKTHAVQLNRKKLVFTERVLQPTKKEAIIYIIVYYVTILFIIKNYPQCQRFIQIGVTISRKKNKHIIQANLLRIQACISLIRNRHKQARDYFYKALDLYSLEGCGLGSASCEAALGYMKFTQEEQYAIAKKYMQNSLKYYNQILHVFGKHYLNRWLLQLKTKINRQQSELMTHKKEAQKLLKQAKISLRSNNINNTELIKHKVGVFVFRFTFDNISLFLEASFEVDTKPKIISELPAIKKSQQSQNVFFNNTSMKFLNEFVNQDDSPVASNPIKEICKKSLVKK